MFVEMNKNLPEKYRRQGAGRGSGLARNVAKPLDAVLKADGRQALR